MIIKQNNFIMIEDSAGTKDSNPEEFYFNLRNIFQNMLLCQRNGDYVQAESMKQRAFQYKKKWEESTLEEMDRRFNEAFATLQQNYNEDLEECNTRWTSTLDTYIKECKNYIEKTDRENLEEIAELKKNLNEQLPAKVKESYQLLNLREMEYHMSKQKDFNQAHLIQNRIRALYAQELAAWNEEKAKKIEQAATNLRNKHTKQRELFSKKMQIQLQDHNNSWHQEKIMLSQRFNNNSKDLKANHEREVGSFKKQFKTKGGMFSSKYEQSLLTE